MSFGRRKKALGDKELVARSRAHPLNLSAREKAKLDDFEVIYRQGQLPVMQAIERSICGCSYGATSWATRDEADLIVAELGLSAGLPLLEIGAGSGWPALYLAENRCAMSRSPISR